MGASREAFALEQVLRALRPPKAYVWATHNGAELDLWFTHRGRRYGVEFKLHEAPGATRSMHVAIADLDPTLRPALLAIARQTGAAYASRFRAHEAAAIDTMVKSGLQIQELTPQAEQEWRQVADGLYPKIRGTLLPADLFDDMTRLVSDRVPLPGGDSRRGRDRRWPHDQGPPEQPV